MATLVDQATAGLERWYAQPGDSDDLRARKAHFTLAFALILPAGTLWGCLYLALGVPKAAAAPLGYVVLAGASFLVLRLAGNFRLFQLCQVTLILLVPLALQLILGGYVAGSAAVAWCLLAPLLAVLVVGKREAITWFALFLAVLVLAALVQPGLVVTNPLPTWAVTAFFVMNLTGPSVVAFAMLLSFVNAESKLRTLERSLCAAERDAAAEREAGDAGHPGRRCRARAQQPGRGRVAGGRSGANLDQPAQGQLPGVGGCVAVAGAGRCVGAARRLPSPTAWRCRRWSAPRARTRSRTG